MALFKHSAGAQFGGGVTVTSGTSAFQAITATTVDTTGAVTIGGALAVTGATTLSSTLTIPNNVAYRSKTTGGSNAIFARMDPADFWAIDESAFGAVFGGIVTIPTLKTGTFSGGTALQWKLGDPAAVSPTSPDRTIAVSVGGTIYYIHAKTTNN